LNPSLATTGIPPNYSVSKYVYFRLTAIIFCLGAVVIFNSCNNKTQPVMDNVKAHAFRLKPGQDLKQGINDFVKLHQLKAGWVSTCVGSLTHYNIRYANQPVTAAGDGHFEIVSLTGTVSINGSHLHLSISDSTGKTIGGHLADSNIVYTTAEIVLLSSEDFIFTREKDGTTPWEELQVKKAAEK
jgi:uncharacterized protein